MGGFSIRGRNPLVGTIGSFGRNAHRVIIDNHVLLFTYNIHGGSDQFILQEDSCGPGRALTITKYLVNEEVSRIVWPLRVLI